MKPFYYIVLFSLLCEIPMFSQKSELKKAESYFSRGEYFLALENYTAAEKLGNKPDVQTKKKIGRCYYYLNNIDKAFEVFSDIGDQLTGNDVFLYASTNHKFGFYEGAIEWYEKAKKEGGNPVQIDELINSCKWALANDQFLAFLVNPSTVLTFGQSFGIQYYKNGVVYSSSNESKSNKDVDKQGGSFKNLYFSEIKDGEIQQGSKLFSQKLVFPYHVGAISFTSDYNTMYYTRAVRIKGGGDRMKIFMVKYDGQDWGDGIALSINSDDYDCAHPAVSPDDKFLYFVSNKKGGYGGKDIYVAEIKGNNKFGEVKNLGKDVNTYGEEQFPFVSKDNILYFSSDGHLGFGGLDIYKCEFIGGKWTNVKNMMRPFNGEKDDFGYVIDPNSKDRGLLNSNRIGGSGNTTPDVIFYVRPRDEDSNATKDEIRPVAGLDLIKENTAPVVVETPLIEVVTPPVVIETPTVVETPKVKLPESLTSVITSSFNGSTVVGANIVLRDANTGIEVGKSMSDSKGSFVIKIPENYRKLDQEFEVEISKGTDFNAKKLIVNIQEFEDIKKSGVSLTPIFNDAVLDDISGMVIPYVGNEITSDGYKILDKLVAYLISNPSIVIKLNGHTDARGNRYTNLSESQSISEKSEKYLSSKGVLEDNLIPRGYGERYLVNKCGRGKLCDESEHLKNRRIEVVVWLKMK